MSRVNLSKRTAPRLSIIVATRQTEQTLERCLRSIVEQEFKDWEVLIADGGSTDGTVALIRRYESHIAWWQSTNDGGVYDAWNKALIRARGEYVTFLGADDAWHSRSTLKDVFASIGERELDMVTGRGVLVNRRGLPYYEHGGRWDYRRVMRKMTICHPGCLHRRDLFERFGVFDTSYRICADYDFLLRLPSDLRTLHLDMVLVNVSDWGMSREHRWRTLRERFRAQASCPRVGRVRAGLHLLDKLWRIPVARVLGMPN